MPIFKHKSPIFFLVFSGSSVGQLTPDQSVEGTWPGFEPATCLTFEEASERASSLFVVVRADLTGQHDGENKPIWRVSRPATPAITAASR